MFLDTSLMLCLSCIDIIFVMQLTNANMTKILTNILGIKSSGMSALQLWDTIKSYITKFVRKGNTQIITQLSFRQTILSAILPPNSKLLFAKKRCIWSTNDISYLFLVQDQLWKKTSRFIKGASSVLYVSHCVFWEVNYFENVETKYSETRSYQ